MQPSKVLVIDDSKLVHRMFNVLMPRASQVYALDGREALDRLAEHPDVDLIILDINMPRMNGLEFLREVKADSTLAKIPVVIISTEGKEEDTIRGLQAGAAAYVRKPFRQETILEIVSRV
ncbi:MAG TPA: response regulator [Thermoanaerobaculia bacterium]|nr:response regulator [Thermoanaerobaculia bacterium]